MEAFLNVDRKALQQVRKHRERGQYQRAFGLAMKIQMSIAQPRREAETNCNSKALQ
jgi:hypothetical protein